MIISFDNPFTKGLLSRAKTSTSVLSKYKISFLDVLKVEKAVLPGFTCCLGSPPGKPNVVQ